MITLERAVWIAENRHWRFGVAPARERWLGFALGIDGTCPNGPLMFFPEVSDGCVMGLLNLERAILLTGALAADPQSTYGPVERWLVDEARRGDPEDFRCNRCGDVGCAGDCESDVFLADH